VCLCAFYKERNGETFVIDLKSIILSVLLLFFIYLSYDHKKHSFGCFMLYLFSNICVIFIEIMYFDEMNMQFMDIINVMLQTGMLMFCLLFIGCSKCGKHKKQQLKHIDYGNMHKMKGTELLNMLEQQENIEATPDPSPFNIKRSGNNNNDHQRPFFPPFQSKQTKKAFNDHNNMMQNEWMNVNDPFQSKQKYNEYNSYHNKTTNPFYVHHNDNNNISRNNNFRNNAPEPMDICSPKRNNNTNHNFNKLQNGMNGLSLTHSFSL